MYSIFDLDNGKMVFQGPFISEHQVTAWPCVKQEDLENLFRRALHVVEQTGRGKNSVSVLEALANGTLDPHNIAFHLLLDIENLLSSESLYHVRYTITTTLDFWSQKMFRGKATRFFRGTMSADADETEGN